MNKYFITLLIDIFRTFQWKFPFLISISVISTLLEGLALTAMLPVLSMLSGHAKSGETTGNSFLTTSILKFVKMIGLENSVSNWAFIIFALMLLSATAFLFQAWLAAKIQAEYVVGWQSKLFKTILNAKVNFIEKQKSGRLVAALLADANRLSGAVYNLCIVLSAFIHFLIYIGIAFVISSSVTMIIVVVASLLLVLTKHFLKRAYFFGNQISDAQAELQSRASEYISQIKAVKLSVAENTSFQNFKKSSKLLAHLNFLNSFDVQKSRAVFEFGGAISVAIILILGVTRLDIPLANIIVILALFTRLLPKIMAVQQGIQTLNTLLPAWENLTGLHKLALEEKEENLIGTLPIKFNATSPDIYFENITAKINSRIVLNDINLHIPHGSVIGLVGSSGAGKTALVDSIVGITQLVSGQLKIGNVCISKIPKKELRKIVGYVEQTPSLFAGSIRNNVSFGDDTNEQKLKEAIQQSRITFLSKKEEGLNADVGDRGNALSGGERQRIGIARALSKDRKIFIFDEMTSALDAENESEIMNELIKKNSGSTIILIAHKFSILKWAQKIFVMEDGSIVESGSWIELDKPGTRFSKLKKLQEVV